MSVVFRGAVSKALVEIDPISNQCTRVCLFLDGAYWIELLGITLSDGFLLPEPLGCECVVSDISDRHWSHADFEITFASSYSREGAFYAKQAAAVDSV